MNSRSALILFVLALVSYGRDVKPILDAHCIECHSAGAFLELSHFPFAFKAPAEQSTIVDMMLAKVGASPAQMPPGVRPKLDESEMSVIREWREQGLAP